MESLSGFRHDQFGILSQWAGSGDCATESPGPKPVGADNEPLPVSFGQGRLFLLQQLDPSSAHYNLHYRFRIEGPLDLLALQRSVRALVNRHATLRTRLEYRNGALVQIADPTPDHLLSSVDDLSHLDSLVEREERLRAICDLEAGEPFHLTTGPACRFRLVRLSSQLHILSFTVHHAATDGWSTGVLLEDLASLYCGRSLPELPIRYSDFAIWQREREAAGHDGVVYWKDRLSGAPAALELPTVFPRPAVQKHRGDSHRIAFPQDVNARLRAIGRQERSSLFMVLLALLNVLLARYTRQDDIIVGTPVSGREHESLGRLVGFFVNTIALRNRVASHWSFLELLRQVRETSLDAFDHSSVPFEQVVDAVLSERDLSRSPVFQVMMTLQGETRREMALSADVRLIQEQTADHHSMFDLSVGFEEGSELTANLVYDAALFDAAFIEHMGDHLCMLAKSVADQPERPIAELDLLTAVERDQILAHWSRCDTHLDDSSCIHELISRQAARTPDALVVVFEQRQITYRELDEKSNQLARYLKRLGAGPETPVGICVARNETLPVAVLGVLKSGAAYVPPCQTPCLRKSARSFHGVSLLAMA